MKTTIAMMTATGLLALTIGCAGSKTDASKSKTAASKKSAHAHPHPSEGPHGGHLIELGNEEYHGEVTHPEGDKDEQQITVYVLDSSAKESVAIEATDVTINVKQDGKPAQFKLEASPDEGDGDGKSSRFVSTDEKLLGHFNEPFIHGTLVLKINDKSFRGEIDIHHDGSGHDE